MSFHCNLNQRSVYEYFKSSFVLPSRKNQKSHKIETNFCESIANSPFRIRITQRWCEISQRLHKLVGKTLNKSVIWRSFLERKRLEKLEMAYTAESPPKQFPQTTWTNKRKKLLRDVLARDRRKSLFEHGCCSPKNVFGSPLALLVVIQLKKLRKAGNRYVLTYIPKLDKEPSGQKKKLGRNTGQRNKIDQPSRVSNVSKRIPGW